MEHRMEHVTEDAQALIRAAREVHVERHGAHTFVPGTYLPFLEAAKRTGIRSDRQRYHDAIEDLEYEGAIEWDKSARYARGISTTSSPGEAWIIRVGLGKERSERVRRSCSRIRERRRRRVSERERGRQAELRAERIRWRGRSHSMSLIHRSDTTHTRQRWRPNMAALRCTCEQGTNLWGEFWWIDGEHR